MRLCNYRVAVIRASRQAKISQDQATLLSQIFRQHTQLDTTNIILAGKDLLAPRTASLAYFALISTYKPQLILNAIRHRCSFRPDLGMLRFPDLDIMLFLPTEHSFLIPKVRTRLFLQRSCSNYFLPAFSINHQFEVMG